MSWEQVGLHYITRSMPQGRYLGLLWSWLNFLESPPAKMGLGAKPRRNLLIQLQHWAIQNKRLCTGSGPGKKINKKAKRKNCVLGRKVQNQAAIFPSSPAAKHSCQQEPWCCSVQSSSTLIAYKPQLGCLWTKQCPFWGLEGPFASFQMGTCTMSSALGKSRRNSVSIVVLGKA